MRKPDLETRAAIARAAEEERIRWERDARYRANIAFAVTQARRLALIALLLASLVLGWPASPVGLLRDAIGDTAGGAHPRVCTGLETETDGNVIGVTTRRDFGILGHQNGLLRTFHL